MAFRILSIDGGGIRGILPGQILVALEQKLIEKTGNPEAKLGQFFDMVAGTSTGAILAAAYACPDDSGNFKFSAQEAVDIYLNDGDKIFDVSIWKKLSSTIGLGDEKYDAKVLEHSLNNTFADIKLSQLALPTCFVSYDIQERQPKIFKQHLATKKEEEDFLVKDVLRGSSAAPTYFETARIESLGSDNKQQILIDGGMVANDPALVAYSEAINQGYASGIADMMIVSIGTGRRLKPYKYASAKSWGLVGWAKPSIDIALEGGPQMVEYHMQQIASTVNSTTTNYFRIKPDLFDASPDLDNATPENLAALFNAGKENAKQLDQQLNDIVSLLV